MDNQEELLEEFVKGPSSTLKPLDNGHYGGTVKKDISIDDVWDTMKLAQEIN